MATQKEKIVRRITELENIIATSTAEMDALREELTTTPDALLERDTEVEIKNAVECKNNFLRQNGYLPK